MTTRAHDRWATLWIAVGMLLLIVAVVGFGAFAYKTYAAPGPLKSHVPGNTTYVIVYRKSIANVRDNSWSYIFQTTGCVPVTKRWGGGNPTSWKYCEWTPTVKDWMYGESACNAGGCSAILWQERKWCAKTTGKAAGDGCYCGNLPSESGCLP